MIKVILADDHPLVLSGLIHSLHKNPYRQIKIQATASDGEQLLNAMRNNPFDLVILDINMPNKDGIEVLKYLHKRNWKASTIACSAYDQPKIIKEAFLLGLDAYVLKINPVQQLYKAIESTLNGEIFMGSGVKVDAIQKNKVNNDQKFVDKFCQKVNLTKRELEILQLVCQALTNKQIGKKLFISDQTVSVHRKNLMRKLGVCNTASLVKIAYENHIA